MRLKSAVETWRLFFCLGYLKIRRKNNAYNRRRMKVSRMNVDSSARCGKTAELSSPEGLMDSARTLFFAYRKINTAYYRGTRALERKEG